MFSLPSISLLESAGAISDSADWSTEQYDITRSGHTASTGPRTNQTLWTFETGSAFQWANPVSVDGVVYVGANDANFYAINASSGKEIWRYTTGGYIMSSALVVEGVVYVSSDDGLLYALNATDGAKFWSGHMYEDEQLIQLSSPAILDEVIYAGTDGGETDTVGYMFAINGSSGAKIWSFQTGGPIYEAPAIVNGIVYAGCLDHYLYALNASDGSQIWSYHTGSPVESDVVVVDGVAYVCSDDGNLYALNAADGAVLWHYYTGGPVAEVPAVADGVAYLGTLDGNLYAFKASDGSKLWGSPIGNASSSSPTVAGDVVYVTNDAGIVYALNAGSGTVIWSYALNIPAEAADKLLYNDISFYYSPIVVTDGAAYLTAHDGKVYAFGTSQPAKTEQTSMATATVAAIVLVLIAVIVAAVLLVRYKRKR